MSNTPVAPIARGRGRRRLAIWGAFAAVGLSTGAIWATGFAQIGGTTGTNPGPTPLPVSGTAQPTSVLAGLATANSTPWTVNWAGLQGSTAAQWFFQVDLSDTTKTPATQHFNIAMLLTNGAAVSGSDWSSLQMKMELYDAGGTGSTCSAADFDGSHTTTNRLMTFDTQDAGSYWNTLPGGKVYCIGLEASNGMDTAGTFLRRSDSTTLPVYPNFVTTVDRTT